MGRLKSIGIISALVIAGLCAIVRRDAFGKSSPGQDKQNAPKPAAQTTRELKKKQWLRQRRAKQATDSALKAHMKHQTKAVRKRMKKDAKKSERYNNNSEVH